MGGYQLFGKRTASIFRVPPKRSYGITTHKTITHNRPIHIPLSVLTKLSCRAFSYATKTFLQKTRTTKDFETRIMYKRA